MSGTLTVYFDGACPLCRREIGFYRRRPGAERLAWVDVSESGGEAVGCDLARADALARFHVRLPGGRLESGARAFAALWCALPEFRWAGRLARLQGLAPLLELAYRGFLQVRPSMQRAARLRGRSTRRPWPEATRGPGKESEKGGSAA